jgi:hypothetical protein
MWAVSNMAVFCSSFIIIIIIIIIIITLGCLSTKYSMQLNKYSYTYI